MVVVEAVGTVVDKVGREHIKSVEWLVSTAVVSDSLCSNSKTRLCNAATSRTPAVVAVVVGWTDVLLPPVEEASLRRRAAAST